MLQEMTLAHGQSRALFSGQLSTRSSGGVLKTSAHAAFGMVSHFLK